MLLSELLENLNRFKALTGKTAAAYTCGPNTYQELLANFDAQGVRIEKMSIGGVLLIPCQHTPEGKFYPCDFMGATNAA